jgi:membrane protease YdiL (CAAX protease family)
MALESFRSRTIELYQNYKWITAIEITIAIIILVGNLMGIIPLTSTIFVLLYAWLTLWLRREGWKDFGLRKPASWKNTIFLAIIVGIVYQFISLYLIEPFLSRLTGELPDVRQFKNVVGNFGLLIFWVAIAWTLAAFGEEMIYRGFFMNRIAHLFKNENTGWMFALLISSILFGGVHLYQGVSGMITVGLFGAAFAVTYYLSGKNLWAPILAHGISDTIGFVMLYLGVYPGI